MQDYKLFHACILLTALDKHTIYVFTFILLNMKMLMVNSMV